MKRHYSGADLVYLIVYNTPEQWRNTYDKYFKALVNSGGDLDALMGEALEDLD